MVKSIPVFQEIKPLRKQLSIWQKAGNRISFVPTMGYLHQGHLSLIQEAKKHSEKVTVCIFVNPTQFGPNEDLDQYPRDTEGDIEKVIQAGGDLVFLPEVEEIYPKGAQTFVEVMEITKPLCGASRGDHLRGVTTVVTKLFNIIRPDVAVFGKKDFQQLAMIQQMVKDLMMDVKVIGSEIIREKDGLAMSSRNVNLSVEQRSFAKILSQSLIHIRKCYVEGVREITLLQAELDSCLKQLSIGKPDYAEFRDPKTFELVTGLAKKDTRLFLAHRFGKTRLIDNAPLEGYCSLDRFVTKAMNDS